MKNAYAFINLLEVPIFDQEARPRVLADKTWPLSKPNSEFISVKLTYGIQIFP
jgi:hypothetical protein